MKKTGWLLALLALTPGLITRVWSQADGAAVGSGVIETDNSVTFPVERMRQPTYADEYCAGFLNKDLLPNANYVIGALDSPNTTKFVLGDAVYLAGTGYATGQQFTVVRELRNSNEDPAFAGQPKMVKAAGHAYAELGRIKVLDTRNHAPVAQVEYSCEPIVPGDSLIPFVEKPHVTLRESGRLDRFLPANGKTTGRLVMARDFDTFLGMGSKVYVNVGSNQGVKVGDYFRAVRPYWLDRDDEVDSISLEARVVEDTQKDPPSVEPVLFGKNGRGPIIHMTQFPRRAVGEMVVLSVTPTSSTAMVIFALEDVHLGDFAEME
jgi:V8-like Glu-specific endopeptidase